MRFLSSSRFIATLMLSLVAAIACLLTSATASAQDIVGGASRTNLSGPSRSSTGSSSPRRPQTKYVTNTRTVTVTRTVVRAPNTGAIVVSAEPGATVVVESVRGGTGDDVTVPQGVDQVAFNKLTPGRYRVAASLEGYEDSEREVVVRAGEPATVSMNMQPKVFTVTIETNIPAGTIVYAPVVAAGFDPATGKTRYNRAPGDARVTPITNRRAVLANLRQGDYGLDINPADPSYEQLNASISLPGPTTIPVTLGNIESKGTFAATWTNLEAWSAPPGWRVDSRKLMVNGRGIALPREVLNRNFKDFQLVSDVKMVNGVAASFVVHAQNENNYYLIQLTGPSADEPYVLRGFAIRNGMPQRIGASIPLDAFTQTLRPNQFFTVSMRMTGNSLKISLTDSQTGDVLPLGILTDPASNYPIGAVGIGARDNEQNEVGRFIVCANQCPEG
ncbi:MAG TPA: carboxypeptidase-like regulatory domain-containing protein [Pyrinomonadaceae bacterium]|nr:carboxypeptidase-like regulatory domain-containing protein [Pyrinomonadaceae bacterium]